MAILARCTHGTSGAQCNPSWRPSWDECADKISGGIGQFLVDIGWEAVNLRKGCQSRDPERTKVQELFGWVLLLWQINTTKYCVRERSRLMKLQIWCEEMNYPTHLLFSHGMSHPLADKTVKVGLKWNGLCTLQTDKVMNKGYNDTMTSAKFPQDAFRVKPTPRSSTPR